MSSSPLPSVRLARRLGARPCAVASLALGAAVLALGCGGDEAGQGSLSQGDSGGGLQLTDVSSADTAPRDTASAPDGTTTGLPAGAPCDADSECAAGWCLPTAEGWRCPQTCAVQACPPDLTCLLLTHDDGLVARVCAERDVTLCQPCTSHGDCNLIPDGLTLNRCVDLGDAGRFCGLVCGDDLPECPAGYLCNDGQCRPESGACEHCTPLSIMTGASTTCTAFGAPEACQGTRSCIADGLSACEAPGTGDEVCNGVDDDCDGDTDEDPVALCGAWACAGVAGCRTSCEGPTDCAPGYGCDGGTCAPNGSNGAVCEDASDCQSAYCENGHCCDGPSAVCCAEDADCAGLDQAPVCDAHGPDGCSGSQVVGRCEDAVCVTDTVPTNEGCVNAPCKDPVCADDGVFHVPHRCDEGGTCVPAGADVDCDDDDPCTLDDCSVVNGCGHAPLTGQTQTTCYSHDPETRGVGACQDGALSCIGGAPSACVGEVGPVDDVCNGVDDDCDGVTDEATYGECAPYVCGGGIGCQTSCSAVVGCGPGAFCADGGECRFVGLPGAPCDTPSQCQSGYCNNGFCCASGTCCGGDEACALFAAEDCATAASGGCSGTRTSGSCNETTHQCDVMTVVDPTVCAGAACAGPVCMGDLVTSGSTCDSAGACVSNPDPEGCGAFTCDGGACVTGCAGDAACIDGATCVNGACVGATADGEACTRSAQCVSGHCENGFCCAEGLCCGSTSDCSVLDEPPFCDDADSCSGSQVVGVCGEGHRCEIETVPRASACAGVACGEAECRNLVGGGGVLEGIRRRLCDEGGACVTVERDCRDYGGFSACANNSSWFGWCSNCSPNRSTCVDLSEPCSCE